MANAYQVSGPDRDDPRQPPCWNEEQCQQACAGVMAENDALRLIEHSASCSRCATLLRRAKDLLTDEVTAAEEALFACLPSSSAAGAAKTASRLHGNQIRSTESAKRRWTFSWWTLSAASFATICLIAFLWFGFARGRTSGDDLLLAQAYDAARPSELRIPGSSAGDVASPTRGLASDANTSTALLQLKLNTQQQFEQNPNKPTVRQTLGRIALIQHNPVEALREFEMAQILDPNLPRLSFDLAGAHFVLAEANKSQSEYDRAIDLFSRQLSLNPADPVALFDRGLAWEHKAAYGRAIADFEAALKDEKDRGWRQVLEAHLKRLRSHHAQLAPSQPENQQDHEPMDPAAVGHLSPQEYERSSEAALRDWLPQHGSGTAVIDQALAGLANQGMERHDAWLQDMLHQPLSVNETAAERELAAALRAYDSGDSDGSVAHSANASKLFAKERNHPGELRARLQHVYGLQTIGQAKPCLEEAARLRRNPLLDRYAVIKVGLLLELSACHSMRGDDVAAMAESQAALRAAQIFSLPALGLRAAGFVMVNQLIAGQMESSLRTGTAALQATADIGSVGVRRFQVLHDMEDVARRNQLHFTVLGLAQEGARAAASSGNYRVSAYALEDLALAQLDVGNLDAARHNFAEADRALAGLGTTPTVKIYRADWQTDRAVLMAKQDGVPHALSAMAAAEPQFEHLAMVTPRARFYTQYADLLRTNGDFAGSLDKVWQAAANSETTLAGLVTPTARAGWLQDNVRTYQVLVADLNDLHRPAEALEVWRWIRTAPYASSRNSLTPASLRALSEPTPVDETLHLVYARLEDHYFGWAVFAGAMAHGQRLPQEPQMLEETARVFARLCADPRSSHHDLGALGQRLSDAFLVPFRDQLAHASSVELDLDDSLTGLPFAALPADGSFFGLTHSLTYVQPALSPAEELLPNGRGPGLRSANLLLLRGAPIADDPLPSAYDETESLKDQFPHANVETVRLLRSGKQLAFAGEASVPSLLRKAQVLHYSGHGLDRTATSTPGTESVFRLSPHSLTRCYLAVIAACRTLGEREDDGNRVSSIAGAFLDAGATQVVATQWDVDSRATQQVMLGLYGQLSDELPVADALRNSMARVARTPQTSHPYFWAAFQIVHRSQPSHPRS